MIFRVPYQPLNLRLTITPELLERITSAVDPKDRQNLRTPLIGFTMALACTPLGTGSVSYIRTTCVGEEQGKGSIQIMNGSASKCYETKRIYGLQGRSKNNMSEKEPENPFFRDSKLCLYARGDGASAGCTMITSILSRAMKKPVRMNLAMTGGITIIGTILPIGGVREKTIAAKRSQVKMIIFPEANHGEFEELEENVKEGLDARFVSDYNQIFEIAFGYDH
ncbi:unnamed protein product [Arabis nemorensis]|uniref:Lon proteolytic domain-containing protein n=1 Tax=Arabis nemorensis TaxID=586526 RepID=A0A565AWN3_9BRAS|nr:unnamed protein product [Arabis nemorensis]